MRHIKNSTPRRLFLNPIAGDSSTQNLEPEIQASVLEDKWLTTREAAEYLRIHPGSLANAVANGTIKPNGKFGRLNRFRQSELKKLLEAKTKRS
ncbi:MAG: helix-turn-helix domain-containing protein [Bdellovibrionales bacterium]|nr:helix-turn-helix domain-containing protein [Bdellovibrionales bacterium]